MNWLKHSQTHNLPFKENSLFFELGGLCAFARETFSGEMRSWRLRAITFLVVTVLTTGTLGVNGNSHEFNGSTLTQLFFSKWSNIRQQSLPSQGIVRSEIRRAVQQREGASILLLPVAN